jgi:hypothetical protein
LFVVEKKDPLPSEEGLFARERKPRINGIVWPADHGKQAVRGPDEREENVRGRNGVDTPVGLRVVFVVPNATGLRRAKGERGGSVDRRDSV